MLVNDDQRAIARARDPFPRELSAIPRDFAAASDATQSIARGEG